MKRFLSFLAALCLFLRLTGQERTPSQGMGKGPKPGDKVPDVMIRGLINTNNNKAEGRLSDFRGKLLIIDFWATWCSPCVAMIPKMDSLQQAFKGRLLFLPVTYQSATEVAAFQARRSGSAVGDDNKPMVVSDRVLSDLFPHQSLPHYVWIGEDGIVKAITEYPEVNAANISRLLNTGEISLTVKKDLVTPYDHSQPLFSSAIIDRGTMMRSDLSGYIEGLGSGLYKDVDLDEGGPVRRITARNVSMPELFRLAYGKEQKETLLEVGKPGELEAGRLGGRAYLDWLRDGHGYCYELMLPESERKEAYSLMKGQLAACFGAYYVGLEKRKVNSLVLVRTTTDDKLKTKGGDPAASVDAYGCEFTSCYLYVFLTRMKLAFRGIDIPLADETGYKGMADIRLTAKMSSVEDVNRALEAYGLKFEQRPAELEMLVIRDRKPAGM